MRGNGMSWGKAMCEHLKVTLVILLSSSKKYQIINESDIYSTRQRKFWIRLFILFFATRDQKVPVLFKKKELKITL